MNKKRKVQKRKTNFFLDNYSKSWNYIKESKKFIWIIVIIFFASVMLGFIFQPSEIVELILNYIEEVLAKTEGMSSLDMILFIFFNNLKVGFLGLIYGFALGVFPVLSIFINGYVVGYVSYYSVSSSGLGSLLSLLPHGIFELPAIFISFGMGLKFGTFLFKEDRIKSFESFFINSLRVFVFVVLPLLIIAAVIEGSLIFLLS